MEKLQWQAETISQVDLLREIASEENYYVYVNSSYSDHTALLMTYEVVKKCQQIAVCARTQYREVGS